MRIRFWGTRGSIPSPLRPEEVEEKIRQAILGLPPIDPQDEEAVRAYVQGLPPLLRGTAGGNTPCVEVQAGGETLIIDAGSGIRELGIELMKGPCGEGRGRLHILITHPHWDHIHGFPMFKPAFVPGNQIWIYGVHDLETAFEGQQRPLYWPVSLSYMQASIEFVSIRPGEPFEIGKVRLDTLYSTHPGASYSYRLQDTHCTLVHASDAEYKHLHPKTLEPYIDFFRNADALIFDAQYTLREAWQKEDWGHSSALIGADLARAAHVKKLILFHHDPTYSDRDLQAIHAQVMAYQAQDTDRPICEVIVAYEGLTLDLAPLGAVDIQVTPDRETAILSPVFTFDHYGVTQLERQLAQLDEDASSIIDLSQVETLTTAGLQALVRLHQKRGGSAPIVLAAPSNKVRQVIELSRYQDFFAIYPSVQAALAAVQARDALKLPGEVIKGRYQIQGRLGESRLGVVLQAVDLQTGQPVAVKLLSPAFSERAIARLMLQAKQVTGLNHPNIVRVLAWDQAEGHFFHVEEIVAGPTLEETLAQRAAEGKPPALSPRQALEIAHDIAQALEYAHARGVVHGNLKPANVFLTEDGARLSGFGLGQLESGQTLLDRPLLFLSAAYLSPEQILGQAMDARTDLYALGVILYQLLSGSLPFEGPDEEVLEAHLRRPPAPLREENPHLSPSLEHMVLKLLAKNPNDRYPGAQQVRKISESLLSGMEVAVPRPIPLIGRQEEVATLLSLWEAARAGQGQLALICGELGVGKSRLAQHVATLSQAPVQLVGHCQERESRPAYHLFSEVLRQYVATAPPEFLDQEARVLCANLTRLVPEIGHILSDLPEPSPLEPEQEQLRLMSSLTQFIKRATARRPWLLILDDLQWADANSLELLRHLCRHLPQMALLLIGIYRDTEVGPEHPLSATLRDLRIHPGYQAIPLERLGRQETAALLNQVWQEAVSPPLADKIYQYTEGNPFYVEEVARKLEEDGLVRLVDGRRHFPDPEQIHLPESVREVVWSRIGHLSPGTQTLLSQAAVLGQTFPIRTLREMSGLSEWQVLEHLEIALERGLVQELPGGADLRFHHPEVQRVLYADLSPLRRRMLHRRAGEVLEREVMPEPERIAEDLAYHFREAGEYERALIYSLTAARQAQAAYDNERALLWYNRTLEMADQVPPEQALSFQATRLLTHQHLGEVLTLIGRYDESLEHCNQARSLLEGGARLSREEQHRLAALCCQTAQICERRGEYDLALTWLEKGLTYLDENEPSAELARIYNLSGWVRRNQGHYQVAQTWLERALALARQAGARQEEADSLRWLGAVFYYLGEHERYRQYSEEALPIYRQIGDRQGEAAILNNLSILLATQGKYEGARRRQQEAIRLWRDLGDRQAESVSLDNLGEIAFRWGHYQEAQSYHRESLETCRELGDRKGAGRALNSLGLVAAGRGEYAQARQHYNEALILYRQIGDLGGEAETMRNQGVLEGALGRYAQAREALEQALQIYRESQDRLGETHTLAHLGRVLALAGDSAAGLERCRQAVDLAQQIGDHYLQGLAWARLGQVLEERGQAGEAGQAYGKACDIFQQAGQTHLAAPVQAGLARLALEQGQVNQALQKIELVLPLLEQGTLNGLEEPFRVALTCYQVLRAADDPRAVTVLEQAGRYLQELTSQMPPEEQETFGQVPDHQALLQAWTAFRRERTAQSQRR